MQLLFATIIIAYVVESVKPIQLPMCFWFAAVLFDEIIITRYRVIIISITNTKNKIKKGQITTMKKLYAEADNNIYLLLKDVEKEEMTLAEYIEATQKINQQFERVYAL